MRIAFYIPVLNIGGAEKVIINLLKEMSLYDYNEYILITDVPNSSWISEIPENITLINLSSRSTIFIRLFSFFKLLKNNNFDLVVSHLTHSNIQCLLLKLFLPFKLVIVEHSITSDYIKNIPIYKRLILNNLIKRLFRIADQIVCVSESTKTDLVDTFNIIPKICKVIYNPIDFDRIRELSLKGLSKSILQKINNRKFIVSVGRLETYKNHLFLIKSLKDYLKKNDHVLVIVGDGTQRQELVNKINEFDLSNFVFLTGYESNPYPYILHSDVLVHPAKFEGFGIVLIEALFLSKPVISMNFKTAFEILNDEKLGMIVEDSESVIHALEILLVSKYRNTFPNNTSQIFNKYNLKKISSEYTNLFKSIYLNQINYN